MAGARPPFPDPIDARYRRHAKLIGVAVTLAVALYVAVYAAWTWERPDRTALLVLAGTGALASLALLNVKTRTPPAGRGRAVLALTWTAVGLGFITALVALDGGPAESPLAATYVLPLLFATLAFPPVAMLISGVAVVATFAVASVAAGATGADTFAYVSALATAAALCWALSRVHHRQRDEFARLSRSDPLTGCLNRRGLEERLSAELARAERHGHPVSLVILDLDRFKDVNDREGHAAGDARLRWTVECLTACIRPSDALGRLGVKIADHSHTFNTELIAALELSCLLDVAETVIQSALDRKESRGSHQRTDFPERDDAHYLTHSLAYRKENGVPEVNYKAVTITRWPPGERIYGR